MPAKRWTLVTGSGMAFEGRCVLRHGFFLAANTGDHIDVYDGRDAIAGRKFARFVGTTASTRVVLLGNGIIFDAGIYISSSDESGETTVAFDPLPE